MFGFLVALPSEARRIVPYRMQVGNVYQITDNAMLIVTGMGEAAVPLIEQHAQSGQFTTLISMGTAVGLAPTFKSGTLCIPDEVVSGNQRIFCNPDLKNRFVAELKKNYPIAEQRLAHASHVLTSREQKKCLHLKTLAGAADMESFLIGREAQRYQLNFLVIRVVLDSMDLHMPESILNCCLPSLSLAKLIVTLFQKPKLIVTLMAFAKQYSQAQKMLHQVTQVEFLHSTIDNRGHYAI